MSFLKKSFFLKQLSSPSSVTLEPTFWQQSFLEEFPIPLTSLDPSKVNLIIRQAYNNILVNNLTTHNLPRFLEFVTGILTRTFKLSAQVDFSTQDFEMKKNSFFTKKVNQSVVDNKKRKRRGTTKQKNSKPVIAGLVDEETTLKLVNLLHLANIISKLVMEMSISYLEGIERDNEIAWIFSEHFEFPPENSKSNSAIEFKTLPNLLNTLIQIVLQLTDTAPHSNYVILIETINLMLTIISSRIFSLSLSLKKTTQGLNETNEIHREENPLELLFLKMNKHNASKLMSVLLTHAFNANSRPVSSLFWEKKHGGSFRRSKKKNDSFQTRNNQLSNISISLVLSLLQLQPPTRNTLFLNYLMNNIQQKKNSTIFSSFLEELKPVNVNSKEIINQKLHFESEIFYNYFEETNNIDFQIALLLYHVINKNSDCLDFLISNKKKLPAFILTILRSIYNYTINLKKMNKKYQQIIERSIYLLLSILFIFTKQEKFCTFIFSVEVSNLSWLKNSSTVEEPIGNIMVLVLCDLIQIYILKSYHPQKLNLCFGILQHLSSYFQDLSIQVSEKIINIFKVLSGQIIQFLDLKIEEFDENQFHFKEEDIIPTTKTKTKTKSKKKKKKKKRNKSKKKFKPVLEQGDYQLCESVLSGWVDAETIFPPPSIIERPKRINPNHLKNHFDHFYKDLSHEIKLCTDLLVFLLDIINTCLTLRLTKNPCFIHILLKNEFKFELFSHHPRLWKYVSNILLIIKYFQRSIKKHKLQQLQKQRQQQSQQQPQTQQPHLQQQQQQQQNEEKTLSKDALISIYKKFAPLLNFEDLGINVAPKKSLKYVEDNSISKKYFLVYTWFLISKYSGIYFDKNILRVLRY
ncbi:dymeclin [Anaeramoeba flamelloides]|uniref:Dymeclin n=1 Tax=Anaeramoeba flamelloides TaxID=1746091 RepID=A0ABQ8ZER9_9EUKA|nr:dymeclin [Anaeramoeba flamelloides]